MLADNILRCDSAGSCMMGDQLLFKNDLIKTGIQNQAD